MAIRDALEFAALILAVLGSISGALLSWQQTRSKVDKVTEAHDALRSETKQLIAEVRAELKELQGSRERHVLRFQEIESDARALAQRLETAIAGDLSRPLNVGRRPGGGGGG